MGWAGTERTREGKEGASGAKEEKKGRKKEKERKKKNNQGTHQRFRRFRPEPPSLPRSFPPREAETPGADPSPCPRGAGQGTAQPRPPRLSPGRAVRGRPSPTVPGVPAPTAAGEGGSPPPVSSARGGGGQRRSCPGSLRSPLGKGRGLPGRGQGLARGVPSPSLRLRPAEPRWAALHAGRRLEEHTASEPAPPRPGPRSRAGTPQGAGKEPAISIPPTPPRGPSLAAPLLRTRGRPAPEPPPNSFKVVLSPWALQRR